MTPRRYRMEGRAAAVEETRRRIIEATLSLHVEKGILGTSWEDIARRADVALATVYRHFPTLNELVPACGERVKAIIRPPTPEAAAEIFSGAQSVVERIERLVRKLFDFYERGAPHLELSRRERAQVPALDVGASRWEAGLEALVREALRPADPDEQTVQVIGALTDFSVWKSLVDRGPPKEEVSPIVVDLVLCWMGKVRRDKKSQKSPRSSNSPEQSRDEREGSATWQ